MPYFQFIMAVLVVFSFMTVARGTDEAVIEKPNAKKAATKKAKKIKKAKSTEAPPVENGMYVESPDPNVDLSEFKQLGYEIIKAEKEPDVGKVPTETRDKLFREAGMTEDVSNWDHFERDVFTMRSEVQPFERMRTWYPNITDKKLKRHQDLVVKWRKTK